MVGFDEAGGTVSEIVANIELELLKNLTGSLADAGWRAGRVRALKAFQKRNHEIINRNPLNTEVRSSLTEAYEQAGYSTERRLTKAIRKGLVTDQRDGPTFTVNDRRLNALIREVQGEMKNVTRAALRQTDDIYRKSVFKVQSLMASNLYSLNECVDIATKDFVAAGLNSITYRNGRRVNITSYSEMALRTGGRRASLWGAGAMRAEFGVYTVLVSQYGACSDTCLPWQGKVYWDDVFANGDPEKNTENWPLLSEAIRGGLYHPNCRHTQGTWYPGVNEIPPPMDEERVKKKAALEERQRYNERQIRKWKRIRDCAATSETRTEADKKVKAWQAKQRELINAHPDVLRRDYKREQVHYETATKTETPTTNQITQEAKHNIGKHDIMDAGKSGRGPLPITDESITEVRQPVSEIFSSTQNALIHNAEKELLGWMRYEPPGTEGAINLSILGEELRRIKGEAGEMRVASLPESEPYIMIHNHPSGLGFSPADINFFLMEENMQAIVAVGNNGTTFFLEKLPEHNTSELIHFYRKLKAQYTNDPLGMMDELMKGVGQYGFHFDG